MVFFMAKGRDEAAVVPQGESLGFFNRIASSINSVVSNHPYVCATAVAACALGAMATTGAGAYVARNSEVAKTVLNNSVVQSILEVMASAAKTVTSAAKSAASAIGIAY